MQSCALTDDRVKNIQTMNNEERFILKVGKYNGCNPYLKTRYPIEYKFPTKTLSHKRFFSVNFVSFPHLAGQVVGQKFQTESLFKDFVKGDLFSTEGFPVSSFRTDDW